VKKMVMAAALALLAGCAAEKPRETKQAEKPKPLDVYKVKFVTSKGEFTVEVRREWAPYGADHFHGLVGAKYFDGAKFYRVLKKYVAQFGVAADPKVGAMYRDLRIPDDPVRQKNVRGMLSFAKSGPASRSTQVFINLANNTSLDKEGFAPFGKVVEGMDVVDKLAYVYGDTMDRGGGGPDTKKAELLGNDYLQRQFPRLDGIVTARIVE
jgi:peptidyl-prolyl cis-trans isomerase A (cyclophilin A)